MANNENNLSIAKFLSGERTQFKRVEYTWGIGRRKGEVVYEIRGTRVIFSSIRSSEETPSTVNAAEAIIIAICDTEGIDWRAPLFCEKYEFYDLSTPVGYPYRNDSSFQATAEYFGLGEIQIDKLGIKPTENYLHVTSWTPVGLMGRESAPQLKPKST